MLVGMGGGLRGLGPGGMGESSLSGPRVPGANERSLSRASPVECALPVGEIRSGRGLPSCKAPGMSGELGRSTEGFETLGPVA